MQLDPYCLSCAEQGLESTIQKTNNTLLKEGRDKILQCNSVVFQTLVNRMNQYFSPFGVNGVLAKNTHKVALRVHCFQIELTFGKFRLLSELEKNL